MDRCFVALALDEAARAELGRLTSRFARSGAEVRWVAPEQMHLTCKFLGDIADEPLLAVTAALRELSAPELRLSIRDLGQFPPRGRPSVLWAGVAGDVGPLRQLVASIEAALEPLGFPPEKRGFKAHVTLGRVKGGRGIGPLLERFAGTAVDIELEPIRSMVLYRSALTPQGARYDPIEEFEW